MAKPKSKKPLPPVVEEARVEERRYEDTAVVAGSTDCKNCGRKDTLVTRVSCTHCGNTQPA